MKLFGILHAVDGSLAVRQQKQIKVSIGLGKGKDVHVHINPLGKWMLTIGGKVTEFKTREECQEAYTKLAPNAPERKAPKKLPYFTFTRPGQTGQEPDFGAIAAHGPMPKEIDVVVFGELDDIWRPAMQKWGKNELQCYGDGLTGHRLVQLARTAEEKAAVVAGERYFSVKPCFAEGCKISQGDNPECKPHAEFFFQLALYPVVGGSSGYSTTGFEGIKALGGVLETASLQGDLKSGMVWTMGLRQYVPRKGSGAAWHATLRDAGRVDAEVAPAVAPPMESEASEDAQADLAAQFSAQFTE
jgi:hypothetical protein